MDEKKKTFGVVQLKFNGVLSHQRSGAYDQLQTITITNGEIYQHSISEHDTQEDLSHYAKYTSTKKNASFFFINFTKAGQKTYFDYIFYPLTTLTLFSHQIWTDLKNEQINQLKPKNSLKMFITLGMPCD